MDHTEHEHDAVDNIWMMFDRWRQFDETFLQIFCVRIKSEGKFQSGEIFCDDCGSLSKKS